MSIADILKEIKNIKDSIEEIKENIKTLQEKTKRDMEKHSAIIIAGAKKNKEESYNKIKKTNLRNFERKGESSEQTLKNKEDLILVL